MLSPGVGKGECHPSSCESTVCSQSELALLEWLGFLGISESGLELDWLLLHLSLLSPQFFLAPLSLQQHKRIYQIQGMASMLRFQSYRPLCIVDWLQVGLLVLLQYRPTEQSVKLQKNREFGLIYSFADSMATVRLKNKFTNGLIRLPAPIWYLERISRAHIAWHEPRKHNTRRSGYCVNSIPLIFLQGVRLNLRLQSRLLRSDRFGLCRTVSIAHQSCRIFLLHLW